MFECGQIQASNFISGNNLRGKYCGDITIPPIPFHCSSFVPSITSINIDITVGRSSVTLTYSVNGTNISVTYPGTTISNNGIPLSLFYTNPTLGINIYKSDKITFVCDNSFPYDVPAVNTIPAVGCNSFVTIFNPCSARYLREVTGYNILGPQQFDYTIYMYDCNTNVPIDSFHPRTCPVYVKYENVVEYQSTFMSGFHFSRIGTVQISCTGTIWGPFTPDYWLQSCYLDTSKLGDIVTLAGVHVVQ